MARNRSHAPLQVLLNNQLVGRLEKETSGAIWFRYEPSWLAQNTSFAISRALPLTEKTYRGEVVVAVFENLLPDNDRVRLRVAERTGAGGTDAYSLLARIGRDCVGALQFLPDDVATDAVTAIKGEPIDDHDIEGLLANLEQAPLGLVLKAIRSKTHSYAVGSEANRREPQGLIMSGRH